MQEGLARNHSADKEVYQSISSDGEVDFVRQPLTFPELPGKIPAIYGIYTETAKKIHNLTSKVAELQQKILEMERHKSNSRFDDSEIFTDVEEQSQFMINYEKKCADRELELQSLAQIYSGQKKLSFQATMCHNPSINGLIHAFLKKHRKVIAYSSPAGCILVLSKEVHPARKKIHMPSAAKRNDSGQKLKRSEKSRSRSRDGNDELEEKDETFFSLQIVNPSNLIFQLDGKMKEIGEDFSLSGLEEIKNTVKKGVSIVRRVKLPSTKSVFIRATCSQEQKCFVLLDNNGKLTVTDEAGSPKASARLGSKEQIVLMEVKGEELWVGSAEGVLRQYSLLDLKPKRVVACHFQEQYQVSSYLLIGSPKPQKVVFSIHRNLYELDLSTCETRKVGQVAESIKQTIGSYLISSQQIARLNINKDKYQILRNEALNRWYHESSLGKTDEKILFLDETKVIVGTSEGDLRMIKL